ncbi:hypothetical protein DFQ30_001621 [Apophysomyces sp. BC1015]|nr:hypothetical protein DFQ30_001621 [Apophysomyces sp. BC1015]
MTNALHGHPIRTQPLPALAVAAVGVVFGDIGTSPQHGIALTPQSILGVISLLFWAIVVVVSLKYVLFVMRADNDGEGGVLALMALALRGFARNGKWIGVLMALGIFGACMFYGDAVITPAMSVMSAVEGLEIAAPSLARYVLPITLVILIALFMLQKHGTEVVGRLFGPVMIVWFVTLALLGLYHISSAPRVIAALNPWYAIRFMHDHAVQAYHVLGSVFLVLTGAEALYADMGHFGAKPIRVAWYGLVMPALVLNYFGQGALLLNEPSAIQNPFYRLAPDWALLPLVDEPGDPARLRAANEDPAYIGARDRPDLHSDRELAAAARDSCRRARLQELRQSRGGVWDRGDHDDGHHDDTRLRRDGTRMELEQAVGGGDHPELHHGRPVVFRREPAEAARRRLAAVADRRIPVLPVDHVVQGAADCQGAHGRRWHSADAVPAGIARVSATPRVGLGDLPDRQRYAGAGEPVA